MSLLACVCSVESLPQCAGEDGLLSTCWACWDKRALSLGCLEDPEPGRENFVFLCRISAVGGGGGKQGQAYSHGFIEHLLYLFQAIFWVRGESSKLNGQSLFPPGAEAGIRNRHSSWYFGKSAGLGVPVLAASLVCILAGRFRH